MNDVERKKFIFALNRLEKVPSVVNDNDGYLSYVRSLPCNRDQRAVEFKLDTEMIRKDLSEEDALSYFN